MKKQKGNVEVFFGFSNGIGKIGHCNVFQRVKKEGSEINVSTFCPLKDTLIEEKTPIRGVSVFKNASIFLVSMNENHSYYYPVFGFSSMVPKQGQTIEFELLTQNENQCITLENKSILVKKTQEYEKNIWMINNRYFIHTIEKPREHKKSFFSQLFL